VVLGGKEWVPDIEGIAWGHWQFTQEAQICVRSHLETSTVTECLQLIDRLEEEPPPD
jgi:hypothetical protein